MCAPVSVFSAVIRLYKSFARKPWLNGLPRASRLWACQAVVLFVFRRGCARKLRICVYGFVVDGKRSLQALRAETMVERFTARMYVWIVETVIATGK